MSAITLFFAALFAWAAWLMPNHYPPWLAFHAELMMALALLLACVGELVQRPPRPDRLSPLMAVGLFGAGVAVLQVSTGLVRFAGDAWVVCAYLLGFVFANLIGIRLAERIGRPALAEGLAGLFVSGALVSIGLQLYQWLRLRGLGIFAAEMPPSGTPFANLAQPNHLATLLFLGLVGVLFLYERRRIGGFGAAAACLFIEAGMVMTGSRTAWLALLLLAVALGLTRRRLQLRSPATTAWGLAGAMLVLALLWSPVNELLLLAPGRSFAVQAQIGPRPLFYATMFDAVAQQPWFGYGWNQGLVAQSRVVDAHPAAGRLMGSSHNLLLDLAIWNGLPLALLFTLVLGWWVWRQVQACRDATQAFMLAAVGGVLVHAMLEYPLSYTYFLLPVGVMMGALDATLPQRMLRLPRAVMPVAALATATLLSLIVVDYMKVEANTQLLRFETARIGTHRILSKAPDLLVLTQWSAYLRFARIELQPGMSAAEIDGMGGVIERFPYAVAMRQYAMANALNKHPDVAARTLARLCALHSRATCENEKRAWAELAQTDFPQLGAGPWPRQR